MKEEDLNNIALQILRSDGKNNWQKLVNVSNAMNVIMCPIIISSKKEFKCRLYLNNFSLPDYGIGSTELDSKCNVVDKFLNRYINISKVSSCSKYTENNRDLNVNIVPNEEITKNIANQINQSDERKVLVKLANLCISKYTCDLWSLLHKYSLSENIKFYPKFSRHYTEHSCSFVFNNMKFEDKIVASTQIDAGRMLAERFIRAYTSNYKEYEKNMDNLFIFIARECQLSRQNESSKTLSSICGYLNIANDKLITLKRDKYICTLMLNHKQYPIAGEGSNENEAFISAIEIFFDKCFSPEILREIQNLKIFNKIVDFSTKNKFADEWKSICNSCKLLGYKCHERFTEGNDTFSVELFVDNVPCGLVGIGNTRNEAGISLGKQFKEKFKNLKELLIDKINQLDEEKFFCYVATLCVDKFWSHNWNFLTKICSKYKISLLKCVKNEINNQIRCSMFIGIYRYEKFVTLTNHDLAFNIVTQHFFTKYGKRNLSENDKKELMKEIAEIGISNVNNKVEETNENKLENEVLNMDMLITKNNEILSDEARLFGRIAAYCISNPKSDDWKTLCNACKRLKQSIYEKFTIHKSNFLCEVYINYQNINISEKSSNRKTAARIVAQKFIKKYCRRNFDEQQTSRKISNSSINDNSNSEQIFKNIAKYLKNNNSNIWDSFCKACALLNHKMEESCESDGKRFVCQVFVENIPLSFTGKESTRRGAKLSFVKQFLDRYGTFNEFSELNISEEDISNLSDEKMEHSKLNISEENISTQSDEKKENFKFSISEESSSTQSDEKMENSKFSISEESSSTQSDEKMEFTKFNMSEENSSTQSDEKVNSMITLESEKMFNKIANFCLLNPVKNEWKTLCNACLSLRYKMIERLISHDGNQFECEVYLNENQINCGVKCFTRVEAEICTARFFIEKYTTIHDDQDEALYEKIASLCQPNSYKDDWKALCNTCKLYKYKYREQIYRKQNVYICQIFIQHKLLDLIGQGNSELKAAIDLGQKFMEKYHKPKTSYLNQNLSHVSFPKELKSGSVTLIEKPVTIPQTSDLKQNVVNLSFPKESTSGSVNLIEKPVTIPQTSILKQNLPRCSFSEESRSGSVILIEKPVTIPQNAKYDGVYFLTY